MKAVADGDIEKIALLVKWSPNRTEIVEKAVESLAWISADNFFDPRFIGFVELTENPGKTWINCARIAVEGGAHIEDYYIEFALSQAAKHGQDPDESWEEVENTWLEAHGSYC